MDFVPKSTRARWKSLESVSAVGWAGSAALGGFLADKYNYAGTFLITAGIQAFATCIGIPLMCVVPRKEGPAISSEGTTINAEEGGGRRARASSDGRSQDDSLATHLLA
jgi:hypothetical protein